MYYLDNAATTIPHPRVLEEIHKLYATCYGNPSSVHPPGQEAEKVLSGSRKTLADIFNVPLAGIVFCASGTESDNLAIKGLLRNHKSTNPEIVISPLEHAAVTKTCDWLETNKLATVRVVGIDKLTGQVDLNHLSELVTANTRMISVQHVNSETGTIQDLAAISGIAKQKNPNLIVHSDGVQAFTRIPVDLTKLGIDLYSISAHKFHGIKGAGALIMNKNLKLDPLVHGGGQEQGLRSGTENIIGVAAMALAAEIAISSLKQNHEKILAFASAFKQSILQEFTSCNLSHLPAGIPHIISVSFPGILGEVLLHHLAERRIYVSTGSACNANSKKLSSVLQAMGYSRQRIRETVRISVAASEIPTDQGLFFTTFKSVVSNLEKMLT